MRILITGATGFLGYHLCQRFRAEGHEVTALHRANSRLDQIHELGVRGVECELTDIGRLRRAIAEQNVVIHAAADIRYWSLNSGVQDQVNVEGSRNIAHACRTEGISRLLHISSTAAIGIPTDPAHPADESFPFNLKGSGLGYHLSKLRGEEAVMEEVAHGLDAVVVNPSSIFGPYGRKYRGGEMIAKVAKGKFATCFTGGISVVHIADVVEGCVSALSRGVRGERYILAGENLSYREISRRSLKALELRKPLFPVPPLVTGMIAWLAVPAGRLTQRTPRFTPAIHYCSSRFQYYVSEKARASLGYFPRGFDAILQEWMAFYRPSRQSADQCF